LQNIFKFKIYGSKPSSLNCEITRCAQFRTKMLRKLISILYTVIIKSHMSLIINFLA